MKNLLFIIIIFISINKTFAQIFNENIIFVSKNGLLFSKNQLQNNSLINNLGTIKINSSFINNSITKGTGNIYIKNNLINNGVINDTNTFYLEAFNTQEIKGTGTSKIFNLVLKNSNLKQLSKNLIIKNNLYLNNVEFNIINDTLEFSNFSTSSINNTYINKYGIITGDSSSKVIINTLNDSIYKIPFGTNSQLEQIYRPLELSSKTDSINKYYTMFYYNTPFDNTNLYNVCKINDKFYYSISQANTDTTLINIYSDTLVDDYFNTIAKYNNTWLSNNINSFNNSSIFKIFSTKSLLENEFYSLAIKDLILDTINNNLIACKGDEITYNISNPNNYTTIWTLIDGKIVNSNNNEITVILDSSTAILGYNYQTSYCNSDNYNTIISSFENPNAGFIYNKEYSAKYSKYIFTDTTQNITNWNWQFGNNQTAYEKQNTIFFEDPGTYKISLEVTDINGCKDTVITDIEIYQILEIPNIFTPNNDGKNDNFNFISMGLIQYEINIFNRWGILIYTGTEKTTSWNGKTITGDDCTAGTYYYVFSGIMQDNSKVDKKGTINLYR